MRPPRDALYTPHKSTASVARTPARRYAKRDRRAYLLQCCRCGDKSTGRLGPRGVLVSDGMQTDYGRHRGCGGEIALFDIKEPKDPRDYAA